MKEEFVKSLIGYQAEFDLELPPAAVERLTEYYKLVLGDNSLLHLVGPCSPSEFATRHVLESLVLLRHLVEGSRFADVGTGAGLPSIPCLLVRGDLCATLIESKIRKAEFLKATLKTLGLADRTIVVNRQFEETTAGDNDIVTCRALDKFSEKLPRLVRWSIPRPMLLFGGNGLRVELKKLNSRYSEELLPMSDARFLFSVSMQ